MWSHNCCVLLTLNIQKRDRSIDHEAHNPLIIQINRSKWHRVLSLHFWDDIWELRAIDPNAVIDPTGNTETLILRDLNGSDASSVDQLNFLKNFRVVIRFEDLARCCGYVGILALDWLLIPPLLELDTGKHLVSSLLVQHDRGGCQQVPLQLPIPYILLPSRHKHIRIGGMLPGTHNVKVRNLSRDDAHLLVLPQIPELIDHDHLSARMIPAPNPQQGAVTGYESDMGLSKWNL